MSQLDFLRQSGFFAPMHADGIPIHVVGVGATGSHIVSTLATSGFQDIHVYDPDVVSGHNIPNQEFHLKHVGMPKVEALKELIESKSGLVIKTHNERVEKIEGLRGVLVMCTDSMEAQKSIVLLSARKNADVRMVLETRLDLQGGRIYAFDPNDLEMLKQWNGPENYSSKEGLESPCNLRAIGTTVRFLAGMAVHRIIMELLPKTDQLYNAAFVSVRGGESFYRYF